MRLRGRTIEFDQDVETSVECEMDLRSIARTVPCSIMLEYYTVADVLDVLDIPMREVPKTLLEQMKVKEVFDNWDKFTEQEFLEWIKNK